MRQQCFMSSDISCQKYLSWILTKFSSYPNDHHLGCYVNLLWFHLLFLWKPQVGSSKLHLPTYGKGYRYPEIVSHTEPKSICMLRINGISDHCGLVPLFIQFMTWPKFGSFACNIDIGIWFVLHVVLFAGSLWSQGVELIRFMASTGVSAAVGENLSSALRQRLQSFSRHGLRESAPA